MIFQVEWFKAFQLVLIIQAHSYGPSKAIGINFSAHLNQVLRIHLMSKSVKKFESKVNWIFDRLRSWCKCDDWNRLGDLFEVFWWRKLVGLGDVKTSWVLVLKEAFWCVFKVSCGKVVILILRPMCLAQECYLKRMFFWFWKHLRPGYGTEVWNEGFCKFHVMLRVRLWLKALWWGWMVEASWFRHMDEGQMVRNGQRSKVLRYEADGWI